MPVFHAKSSPDHDGFFEISPEDAKHLTRVLRVKPGGTFEALLKTGELAQAILHHDEGKYRGKVKSFLKKTPATSLPLWLGVGMIRWPRLEWLVEKATELGVKRITPLLLQHSRISSEENFSQNKYERLHKIAQETLKQCARLDAPRIDKAMNLDSFLKEIFNSKVEQKIIFNEKILQPILGPNLFAKNKETVLLVGPEGGFAEAEIGMAETAGFESVSLGAVTLRAETAAIYGACVVSFLTPLEGDLT
jgi:16S rRNA (uracil1498-N3)-methyltransferase